MSFSNIQDCEIQELDDGIKALEEQKAENQQTLEKCKEEQQECMGKIQEFDGQVERVTTTMEELKVCASL